MDKDTTTPPTQEIIAELYDHNDRVWSTQRDKDKDVLEVIADTYPIVKPDTENPDRVFKIPIEEMRSGLLPAIRNRTSAFYPVMPALGVVPQSGVVAESKAGEAEEWAEEWVDQAQEDAGEDTWGLIVADGLAIGRSVDIVLGAAGYWWDYPSDLPTDLEERHEALIKFQSAAPVPAVWRHIPAECVFPPSLGRMSDEQLVVQDVLLADVLDHFGETATVVTVKDRLAKTAKDGQLGSELYTPVQLLTYANREYMAWAVRHEALGRGRDATQYLQEYHHKMGVSPIRITPTFVDSRKKPGQYWTCPVAECVHLVKQLDRRLSEWATFGRMGVGTWLFEVFDDDLTGEGTSERMQKRQWGDAWLVRVDPQTGNRENIRSVAPPEMGRSYSELTALTMNLIERKTGISPALSGQGLVGSQTAAAAIKINADLASELYQPASANLTRHGKSVLERCFAAVAAFGEPATLSLAGANAGEGRTLTLTPEAAKGWRVNVKAELQPRFQVTRTSDIGLYMEGERMAAAGAGRPWPERWGVEELLRVSDTARFRREKRVDRLATDPELEAVAKQMAMAKARVKLNTSRMATEKELLEAQAEGILIGAPEEVLVGRGKLPARGGSFPAAATSQSVRQTGVTPPTVQEPREP